ncbi:hypothetical protein [Lacticaseibacillus sp. N501-2]|uniref:hypothetical protein n=1 Tax=Lacticaseibacillus salsurae TaxID=3367729 RepID=UPI0038B2441D
MQRRRQKPRKKHWGRRIFITLLILVAICGLGVIFFPQLNNTMRDASGGNDTVADKAVKSALVSQLNAQKNGDAATDAVIDTATATITNTKMSTLMKAAKDQSTATAMLEQNGLPKTAATAVSQAIYSNAALTPIREKLASGDYAGVYQAVKATANDGSALSRLTQQLQQDIQ